MIQLTKKKAQVFYTLVQCFYWITTGFMYSFASVYLQGIGFTNSQIGIFLGCAYGLAACIQPLLASFIAAKGLQIKTSMKGMYGFIVGMATLVLVLPMPQVIKAVILVLLFAIQSAAIPCVNTLVKTLEYGGVPVNFGLARGIASLVYAVALAIMGRITLWIDPKWIPAFYIGSAMCMLLMMSICNVPKSQFETTDMNKETDRKALFQNKAFIRFVMGAGCLFLGLACVESFMLQIMQNVKGNSADMSLALSVASVSELPALFFYTQFRKWFGNRKLLMFAGWAWVLRFTLVLLAASPALIFVSQMMHFCTYAFYTPASIDFMSEILPAMDFLKGQALLGSICSVGSVFATFCGGILLDLLGVSATLIFIIGMTAVGAILFTMAVTKRRQGGYIK